MVTKQTFWEFLSESRFIFEELVVYYLAKVMEWGKKKKELVKYVVVVSWKKPY